MKTRPILLPLLSLLLLFLLASCLPQAGQTARVARVIDGDTIELAGGQRVRYIGIDAPEQGEPLAREATEKNRKLVEGKAVRLETDVSERDRYGRRLRYVWIDRVFVNGELVRLGLARAQDYPPDSKYKEELARLEREARAAGQGLWGALSPVPPRTIMQLASILRYKICRLPAQSLSKG